MTLGCCDLRCTRYRAMPSQARFAARQTTRASLRTRSVCGRIGGAFAQRRHCLRALVRESPDARILVVEDLLLKSRCSGHRLRCRSELALIERSLFGRYEPQSSCPKLALPMPQRECHYDRECCEQRALMIRKKLTHLLPPSHGKSAAIMPRFPVCARCLFSVSAGNKDLAPATGFPAPSANQECRGVFVHIDEFIRRLLETCRS